jgi:hypothetical protein
LQLPFITPITCSRSPNLPSAFHPPDTAQQRLEPDHMTGIFGGSEGFTRDPPKRLALTTSLPAAMAAVAFLAGFRGRPSPR